MILAWSLSRRPTDLCAYLLAKCHYHCGWISVLQWVSISQMSLRLSVSLGPSDKFGVFPCHKKMLKTRSHCSILAMQNVSIFVDFTLALLRWPIDDCTFSHTNSVEYVGHDVSDCLIMPGSLDFSLWLYFDDFTIQVTFAANMTLLFSWNTRIFCNGIAPLHLYRT